VKSLVAFVGFVSCGKDTVADCLLARGGYTTLAFADSIKDCLSSIFCWDRDMIEGKTKESRAWREMVDPWWAAKLGMPNFSPRWAMTNFGTDVMREHFNPQIWILNTRRRAEQTDAHIIIKDVRFVNEIDAVRSWGGQVKRIRRGPEPSWFGMAQAAALGDALAIEIMAQMDIHRSEWEWTASEFDGLITNDGSLDDLRKQVDANL
jgi:hypothetical protein